MTNILLWAVACFAWDLSDDPDLIGHQLYWGPAKGVYTQTQFIPYDRTNTCVSVLRGVTNFFVLTAVGVFGFESVPTQELVFSFDPPSVCLVIESSTDLVNWTESHVVNWTPNHTNAMRMYRGRMEFR